MDGNRNLFLPSFVVGTAFKSGLGSPNPTTTLMKLIYTHTHARTHMAQSQKPECF